MANEPQDDDLICRAGLQALRERADAIRPAQAALRRHRHHTRPISLRRWGLIAGATSACVALLFGVVPLVGPGADDEPAFTEASDALFDPYETPWPLLAHRRAEDE